MTTTLTTRKPAIFCARNAAKDWATKMKKRSDMDSTADLVRALAWNVRDLAEPQRFMTVSEREMLRQCRHDIQRLLDADLLLRMRELPQGQQIRPRLYLDVCEIPEDRAGVSSTELAGFESAPIHALPGD